MSRRHHRWPDRKTNRARFLHRLCTSLLLVSTNQRARYHPVNGKIERKKEGKECNLNAFAFSPQISRSPASRLLFLEWPLSFS